MLLSSSGPSFGTIAEIGIDWGVRPEDAIVSGKDRAGVRFSQAEVYEDESVLHAAGQAAMKLLVVGHLGQVGVELQRTLAPLESSRWPIRNRWIWRSLRPSGSCFGALVPMWW